MLKNAYFLEKKTVKIVSAAGLRPQTSILLLPTTVLTLSSSFYITLN